MESEWRCVVMQRELPRNLPQQRGKEAAREKKRFRFGIYALVLFLIIVMGRAASLFYSYAATDISYDAWVSTVLQWGTMVFAAAKNVLGYAAVAYCAWYFSEKAGNLAALLFFAGLVIENAARFVLDCVTSSLVYGWQMALMSLLLQLAYETVFLILACLIVRLFKHLKKQNLDNVRKLKRYTAENAARVALLLLLAAQLVSELLYLLDFLSRYTDITNAEIASCVGSFLSILVMDGGVPLLLCEAAFWFVRRMTVREKSVNLAK